MSSEQRFTISPEAAELGINASLASGSPDSTVFWALSMLAPGEHPTIDIDATGRVIANRVVMLVRRFVREAESEGALVQIMSPENLLCDEIRDLLAQRLGLSKDKNSFTEFFEKVSEEFHIWKTKHGNKIGI